MKILEIGAGTGAMTRHVLANLMQHGEDETGAPRFAQFDYTDTSRSFFEKAQDRFGHNRKLHFKALNIEENPVEQGFEEGSYDLVVASAVSSTAN
jgi:SAM-dependent methyltransferase